MLFAFAVYRRILICDVPLVTIESAAWNVLTQVRFLGLMIYGSERGTAPRLLVVSPVYCSQRKQ